jgi:hypothetical protein
MKTRSLASFLSKLRVQIGVARLLMDRLEAKELGALASSSLIGLHLGIQ